MNSRIEFDRNSGKFFGYVDGKLVKKSKRKEWVEEYLVSLKSVAPKATDSEFTINERFDFVTDLVTLVSSSAVPSAIITGEGGLGKSYTVMKALKDAGLTDVTSLMEVESENDVPLERDETMFSVVKGYSTPKGLYNTLYNHRNSTVVFDDCDSILKDPVALNLLKSALDSYSERYISWSAESKKDDEIPSSFRFDGRVIFISNLSLNTLDGALRSRSLCVDLSMTLNQKIERMEVLIASEEFLPNISLQHKKDAIELIRKMIKKAGEISLRTLIKVCKIRASESKNWEKLASYLLMQ